MKSVSLLFFFIFCSISAQKTLPFDTLKIKETKDFFADDYGNVYLYKNRDFSLTKYDSLGKQLGRMMLTVPFKVQNVQNPLKIVLFSENAQEMRFVDQNLNVIQKIDLTRFGFIRAAYAGDLQQIWLLDESMKRLVQYNFRENRVINSTPFTFSSDDIRDFLIFGDQVFILYKNLLSVRDLLGRERFAITLENGQKLRRENDRIYIITSSNISQLADQSLKTVFSPASAEIVDKNSGAYFEISGNKVYIYRLDHK